MRERMIAELRSSSERIGQLYPILLDHHGNVIDGEHRYGADEGWRTIRLDNIRTERDRLIARIISNTVRRSVPQREKTKLLSRLGEIYLMERVEPGKIAHKIEEETGMSYRWVMKYLSERFKDSAQSERASSAARRAAGILDELLRPPKREGALKIKRYANADFVSLILERGFYEEFERRSLELGVSTELSALKALEDHHEKMRRAIALKNKSKPSGEGENHRT